MRGTPRSAAHPLADDQRDERHVGRQALAAGPGWLLTGQVAALTGQVAALTGQVAALAGGSPPGWSGQRAGRRSAAAHLARSRSLSRLAHEQLLPCVPAAPSPSRRPAV